MSKLIKKYKNRRLYDMGTSQYITIEAVRQYVTDGVDFRIEEASSGKDITSIVLMQILMEMESGPSQFLSPDILKQLIGLANHPMHEAFKMLFEQMMIAIQEYNRQNPYWTDLKQANDIWHQQVQQVFEQWKTFFAATQHK